ncbi:vWA domain-containing protein [Tunturibacter empetritectus]|uniref:VWA domain-containing protein n=1 Tax=Tunturiibacter lichenicola TaxID=2051959 RepID=A0A7W8J9M1_9BACT|nr:hypothetical protein [Edaphobacter lichenicola]MBB5345145.1 hypothetical protein [Edaphobacter lichenicola]
MTRSLLALTLLAATTATTTTAAHAQEAPATTQALVAFDSKAPVNPTAKDLTIKIDNRVTPLINLAAIPPGGAQVALLMDDGLRTSVAREMNNLRAFITSFPAGTEVFVGYMQNGTVFPGTGASGFTSDLAAAAQGLRIPSGIPGSSASPYFCLSEFVKNWPGQAENQINPVQRSEGPVHKPRFVLMITNGVDPYNGSTSPLNQNSPYVDASVTDAQRAGVPVYSIYFSDAGFARSRSSASFSGQNYLSQLAEGTGGLSLYQSTGQNPVSMEPYLKQFQEAIARTYVATFPVDTNKKLVSLRTSTDLPKTKLRAPSQVRPGTVVAN